jgi:hypothetical protein
MLSTLDMVAIDPPTAMLPPLRTRGRLPNDDTCAHMIGLGSGLGAHPQAHTRRMAHPQLCKLARRPAWLPAVHGHACAWPACALLEPQCMVARAGRPARRGAACRAT